MTRKQKKHLARIIAAAVLLALVWFVLPLEGIWQLLAYCVPYFIVGWDVLWGAIRKILHGDLMDEEFLMSVATIGAFVLGDYREAVACSIRSVNGSRALPWARPAATSPSLWISAPITPMWCGMDRKKRWTPMKWK